MELLLGYEILESYKRLSYKEWYALAEFIDNSTQSYRNHAEALDRSYEEAGTRLSVKISYDNSKPNDFVKVEDNAYGMTLEELKRALILGKKPVNDRERSKYGLGMKTASFWFGDQWSITTTQIGQNKKYSVVVDLHEILESEKTHLELQNKLPEAERRQFAPQLRFIEESCDENEHGTTLEIKKLNRKLTPSRARKSVNFLKSIYRVDLSKNRLRLVFQDEELSWNHDEILNRILIDRRTGDKMYREFTIPIGDRRVIGWAGILKRGSKQDAGFSLLQAERVIQGWPDSYRPSSLFGDQEGGTNTLTNQRLFGELTLDGFEVSHTKDEILFQEDEEDILKEKLLEELADFKKYAEEMRVTDDVEAELTVDVAEVARLVVQNLQSPDFRATVLKKDVLPVDVLEQTNSEAFDRVAQHEDVRFEAHIDNLLITVIISDHGSPYDPYILIQARAQRDHLTIVVNKRHIYYSQMKTKETVYEFLRNCIYDGISEWKANFIVNSLHPDTIKTIKDHLLRVPIELPF
jgi:hypothetical protein